LFFYIPFSMVLIKEGYPSAGILGWLGLMVLIIQIANFLNFLINKNNKAFVIMVVLLGTLIAFQQFNIFDVAAFGGTVFDSIVANPVYCLVPLAILLVLYQLNYRQLRSQVYLDEAVSQKVKEAKTVNLSWADRLGDVAPFIKNDMRLIWRNKRTKTVFLMSFIFLFYGLIFFTQDTYNKMPTFLVFVCIFITGGFTINYGQFIPAWDSSHYKMIMSQNVRYRKFLESKWFLMVAMTGILYFLSVPYLYFGVDKFLIITAGAVFNIGFNSLFLLYAGSFNRKRIDLERSGFSNMQGTSAMQFLIIIPIMGVPMLLFYLFNLWLGFNVGVISIAVLGVLGIAFKNYFMNLIEKKYIADKYAAIHAFGKEA